MRICKDCGIEKPLSEFYKTGKWYRNRCKKCQDLKFRPPTGKPNEGRFKKGHIPITKVGDGGRESLKGKKWRMLVFEKDNYVCQKCFSDNNLHAHHVRNWNDYSELRYEVNNGLTLCSKCHRTLHNKEFGFKKGHPGVWLGKKFTLERRKKMSERRHTEETKKKISEVKKGHIPWNKNTKGIMKVNSTSFKKDRVPWNKGLKLGVNNGNNK